MFFEISQNSLATWFDSPGSCNFVKKEALKQMFPCEFWESFKNTYLEKHLRISGSDYLEISQQNIQSAFLFPPEVFPSCLRQLICSGHVSACFYKRGRHSRPYIIHFLNFKTRNTEGCNFKGYFRSFRVVVYQFWANLGIIFFFFVKVSNLHISCNYFPFLVCQRGVQLLYETLDTLIENSAVLQSDSFGFVDRQTYKSKDQALKQYCCLRRKNNFSGYRRPNNFLLPQFAVKELHLEIFFPKDFPKFSKPISRNVFRCLVS